jgi:hypothetical protein
MTDTKIFNKLEIDIMKVLTRASGIYHSQFKIYNELIEDLTIKDPVEKDNLKTKVLTALRVLPHTFDNIKVIKENDILYVAFSPEKEDIKENIVLEKNEELKDSKWLSEMAVINFIIDENMNDYLYKKDYTGNTVLHSLILNNDELRLKKAFNKLKTMLNEKNIDNQTPVETINTFKISNFFMNYLINENNSLKKDVDELKIIAEKLKKYLLRIYFTLFFLSGIIFLETYFICNFIHKMNK